MEWTQYIFWPAYLISGVVIVIGIAAVLLPEKASAHFGIQMTGAGLSYVRATGARDIFLGLVILIVLQQADASALVYTLLAIPVVSLVDFYVTWKSGNRRESFIHLAATMAVLVYAGLLILSLGE